MKYWLFALLFAHSCLCFFPNDLSPFSLDSTASIHRSQKRQLLCSPRRKVNETCDIASGLICNEFATCIRGVCTVTPAGTPCTNSSDCGGSFSLYCINGTCNTYVYPGDPCGNSANGASCFGTAQCINGRCPAKDIGEPCSGSDCNSLGFCSSYSKRCERRYTVGRSCASEYNNMQSSLRRGDASHHLDVTILCANDSVCDHGTCTKYYSRAENNSCEQLGVCERGLACNTGTKMCIPQPNCNSYVPCVASPLASEICECANYNVGVCVTSPCSIYIEQALSCWWEKCGAVAYLGAAFVNGSCTNQCFDYLAKWMCCYNPGEALSYGIDCNMYNSTDVTTAVIQTTGATTALSTTAITTSAPTTAVADTSTTAGTTAGTTAVDASTTSSTTGLYSSTTGRVTSTSTSSSTTEEAPPITPVLSEDDNNEVLIVAIPVVAASILFIIAYIIGTVLFVKYKKKPTNPPPSPLLEYDTYNSIYNSSHSLLKKSPSSTFGSNPELALELALSDNYEIKFSDLQIINPPLGHGSFGVVNKAVYKGTAVAVKTFVSSGYNTKSTEEFKREVLILRKIHHPNIVLLIGMCIDPVAIVMEYASNGSLLTIIQQKPSELTTERIISVSFDVACGMAYLHSLTPPIIHRDLKTGNIMVGDFGISREFNDTTMTTSAGTIRWAAPELFQGHYSPKVDCYSYAILLWEMVSKQLPFANLGFNYEIQQAILSGQRMEIPESCPDILKNIITQCWDGEPTKRPSFLDILGMLKQTNPYLTERGSLPLNPQDTNKSII